VIDMAPTPRFLLLADVAEILNTSSAQVYALVRRGELRGIKIGGRGQWRVEVSELEVYIARMYDEASRFVDGHPFPETEPEQEAEPDAGPEDTTDQRG
jgi:excisionase family DNA binding protein